jgi:hypothetical protein
VVLLLMGDHQNYKIRERKEFGLKRRLVESSVVGSFPPSPPASKPRSSIRAGASRKHWLKRASKFRKHASGDFGTLPAIVEVLGPKHTSHELARKAHELQRGNEVFWCATEGYFNLLVLFKEVPTPSISPTLVINGNVQFLNSKFLTSLDFIWRK